MIPVGHSKAMNLSSVPGFGTGIDPYQAINAIASRQAQQAQQAQLKMVLMMVLAYTGANANSGAGALTASNPGFGGGGRSQNGVSSFLGASPAGGTGGSGDGQAAVDLARKFAGKDSSSIKGKMPHFTAAGGITNNCADFVSSALESQGLIKGHHINVKAMEQELKKQGYVQVPASQAKPGDVWMSHSRSHTELVATKGATKLIGSNKNGDSRQEITEHSNQPNSGIIYQKR